jgi:hypothetical protein
MDPKENASSYVDVVAKQQPQNGPQRKRHICPPTGTRNGPQRKGHPIGVPHNGPQRKRPRYIATADRRLATRTQTQSDSLLATLATRKQTQPDSIRLATRTQTQPDSLLYI